MKVRFVLDRKRADSDPKGFDQENCRDVVPVTASKPGELIRIFRYDDSFRHLEAWADNKIEQEANTVPVNLAFHSCLKIFNFVVGDGIPSQSFGD